jgi:anti-sigma factor (TIGR02949 family)
MTTRRMRCEDVVRELWPLLDGALSDADREPVVAHLVDCAGCRSHRDFASAFLDAVRRSTPNDSTYATLRTRVQNALREELPAH